MLSADETHFLAKVPIFGGLPESAVERLGTVASRLDFDGPALVFAEGEPAREMVVVLHGELEVRKKGLAGGETRIATLRAGDVAGEMSLIDIQPRSAAVRTLGAAQLLVLRHGDLAMLYREDLAAYTMLVMNIAREISRRLRRVDGLLANLLIDMQEVWAGAVASSEG